MFQKKFGQNFLIDTHVLEKIMNAAQISKDDCVVEVGPGIGTMTQYLAERAGHVVAVEIDKALIPILSDTLSAYDNVEVINEDILKVDLNRLVQEKNGGDVPSRSLPIFLITSQHPSLWDCLKAMCRCRASRSWCRKKSQTGCRLDPVQRIMVLFPWRCSIMQSRRLLRTFRRTALSRDPMWAARSSVWIAMQNRRYRLQMSSFMFSVIRASFNQRRKTLVNGLSNAPGLNVSKEKIKEVLARMELSETVRGETLTLEQFAQLADLLRG